MLFPSTADHHQARGPTELALATPHIAPNLRFGSAQHGQHQQHQRKHSTPQFSSASPMQNPRVSDIQDTGHLASSTSSQFQSTGQHFYASSAPSSTTGLHQQSPSARPPVPLFQSNSTGNMAQHRAFHTTHNFPEGTASPECVSAASELTSPCSEMSAKMFFFTSDFNAASDTSPDHSLDDFADISPQYGSIAFESINHPTSAIDSVQTISPKDIMVDTISAPASTTFTNLTTPGTSYLESPLYMAGSTDTSPLFAEDHLGAEADNWPSLFGDENTHHVADQTAYILDSPSSNHVAPHMSRNASSPGKSSTRSSQQGRHSFASGVSAKRRDKPLPAITIADPEDTVAVKRARNTMAARKSREKRVKRTDELLARNAELEKENDTVKVDRDYWKNIALSRGHVE